MDILDRILEAANQHGQDIEPEMEVGDLQQLARDLWSVLTPEQRQAFPSSSVNIIDWAEFVNTWLPEEKNGQGQDLRRRGPQQGQDDNRSHSQRRSRKS